LAATLGAALAAPVRAGAPVPGDPAEQFHRDVEPILSRYCYDCHGYGAQEGSVTFDEFESDEAVLGNRDLWFRALRMLRAGMMPPVDAERPSPDELARLEQWIKSGVFRIDPNNPDPGRVTVRRLNRVEYENTIRDLVGVDFDVNTEFPPDDSGHGFDNIGDVLTVSPLLLEKYIAAAETIVAKAVPLEPGDKNYERFFPREVPDGADARRAYATELLGTFATKAFRRRVDQATAERLADLAVSVDEQPGQSFESGVAQAMAAVLASPRFLFREEGVEMDAGRTFPLVDEYALATRLSYFLWSTTPDDELMRLAREHKLRSELDAQIERMTADDRFEQFIRQFAGQWLRARDVETWPVDGRAVMARENPDRSRDGLRRRFRRLQRKDPSQMTDEEKAELEEVRAQFQRRFGELRRAELDGDVRRAMRRETEMLFGYIVQEDRSLLELIDADYTFLNERLARQYGIDGVEGDRMRKVNLPEDSPRGGVLTQGTTLVVTSNPDRTSPAKRGLYVLETLLGTPPPPPPPNIPSLEQTEADMRGQTPTARELLELHRADPLCAACHNRMDPLGLALENFNPLGAWRDQERKQPIDAAGVLITGEEFTGVAELKAILAGERHTDFYRCATEKLLTYALGRGLEYNDVEAVDRIVAELEKTNGRASELLLGVIKSEPFQRTRLPDVAAAVVTD
jgi:hypothetical protein